MLCTRQAMVVYACNLSTYEGRVPKFEASGGYIMMSGTEKQSSSVTKQSPCHLLDTKKIK